LRFIIITGGGLKDKRPGIPEMPEIFLVLVFNL
jgi:hypothetical protein